LFLEPEPNQPNTTKTMSTNNHHQHARRQQNQWAKVHRGMRASFQSCQEPLPTVAELEEERLEDERERKLIEQIKADLRAFQRAQ